MKDLIKEWLFSPARWYQFWLPQSGFVGGLVMGAAMVMGAESLFLVWVILSL